jgi:protein arginine N-methyltransferase 1
MLADYTRLDSYAAGIGRAVKPRDVVLDLGCGTGILSMFAAQRNPEKIYAIDHSDIIELAKRVAEHNGVMHRFCASEQPNFSRPTKRWTSLFTSKWDPTYLTKI